MKTKYNGDYCAQEESENILVYCEICVQMTNHNNSLCMKHQPEKEYDKYPTFYETVVHSPQWQAWTKVAHTYGYDWHESTECGWLSENHFDSFIRWVTEEAVEAERARIREGVDKLKADMATPIHELNFWTVYNRALSDALQVINEEEIPRNPLDQNKWM